MKLVTTSLSMPPPPPRNITNLETCCDNAGSDIEAIIPEIIAGRRTRNSVFTSDIIRPRRLIAEPSRMEKLMLLLLLPVVTDDEDAWS